MKIKITVPKTGVQVLTHQVVNLGDVVDLPHHQAEHLIRLGQAEAMPEVGGKKTEVRSQRSKVRGLIPPTTAEI